MIYEVGLCARLKFLTGEPILSSWTKCDNNHIYLEYALGASWLGKTPQLSTQNKASGFMQISSLGNSYLSHVEDFVMILILHSGHKLHNYGKFL